MARPRVQPTAKKAPSAGARRIIGQVLEEGITKQRVKGLLDAAFEQPDLKRQLDTLIALLEQAEGRPKEAQPEALTIIIERPPL